MHDNLATASITNNLETRFIGQRVFYYPQLTSTMDIAKQKAQHGAAEGTVVIAGEQTAGKGRVRRIWLSPKGSIALSIILYPDVLYLPYLVMLASLAVVHSIKAVTDLEPQIKWPNDILIDGRKICGILIESGIRRNTVVYVIIGIGINVNFRLSDFPEIMPAATSLASELDKAVSRVDLIRCLLAEIERLYLVLPDGESIYQEWQDRLVTLGRNVRVESGTSILTGTAEAVARDGSLLLRHSNGNTTKIVAGDVTLRDYG